MPHVPLQTPDIRGQLILLGTGTSVGVPAIGCGCAVCLSENPRNKRTRCSAVLGLPEGNLLIDTPPDLREQLLREQIGLVHATVFTHEHADHLMGLDDLRLFQFYLKGPVQIFCEPIVEQRIRAAFHYAFLETPATHSGARPKFDVHSIGLNSFTTLGAEIIPIRLKHGPQFDVLGFRVGNVAYCTDTNGIPEESMEQLQGLDTLILDGLRHEPHVTHYSIDEAAEVATRLGAKQTWFTHCSHELEYETVNATLPPGMELAYDGLRIPLT